MRKYAIAAIVVLVCAVVALGAELVVVRNNFAAAPEMARVYALQSAELSPLDCSFFMPGNSRDICFHELAKQRTDASFCGKISGTDMKSLCYFEIYSVKGELAQKIIETAAVGDINLSAYLCNRSVGPEQEICDGYISLVTDPGANDTAGVLGRLPAVSDPVAMCAAILRPDYRDSCFSSVGECDRVEDVARKDSCFLSLAATNSSLCARIAESPVRDDCYEWFVRNGDYSVCVGFSNTTLKEQCEVMEDAYKAYGIKVNYLPYGGEKQAIEKIAADSPEMAERICDVVLKDDSCYYALAVGTGNASYCQGIGSQPGIDLCLSGMAERMNDSGI